MAKDRKKRARGRVEQNAFVKGLITEASPLTFPENASLAEENFVLNRDGSRQRRLGMDFEHGHGVTDVQFPLTKLTEFETFIWKDAANNRSFDIAVVKVENLLYFYDGNDGTTSAAPLNNGVPIVLPVISPDDNILEITGKYDFTSIHGFLIVTNSTEVVHIVEFDVKKEVESTPSVPLTSISFISKNLDIRDLFGIDEPIVDDHRPSTLDQIHKYNLRNQGWLPELQCAFKGTLSPEDTDTIDYTFQNVGVFPSNADMVWANKVSSHATVPEAIGAYDPFELTKSTYNNQEAPKGRYIIDVFKRGQTRANASDSIEDVELPADRVAEETLGGVTAVTSYMGRAVYAASEVRIINPDDESPSVGSMLFFSQARDSKNALTDCHTQLDPTAGEEFANLATDGGFVPISGLGQVLSLEVHGNSLYVFSDRGVWEINGGGNLFTMTNININKISDVGSLAKNSVVSAEDKLLYLTDGGIYAITGMGQEGKQSVVENITQSTIQTFYDDLPSSSKRNSVNYYDKFNRKIKWLFASKDLINTSFYNTELVFDLNLGAFYIHDIKPLPTLELAPYIIGYLERATVTSQINEELITADGVPVTIYTGTSQEDNLVISFREPDDIVEASNKYWCVYAEGPVGKLTVSEYNQLQFLDWNKLTGAGTDAEAFLITGHSTAGDSATFKRVPYITTHMKRTETEFFEAEDGYNPDNPSSCSLQAQWEWTNSPESGRWSNPQEIYRLPRTFVPDSPEFDYGHEVITTKNRLRGKGRAFSLLFKTKPLHDCQIYGWSIELDAEVSV